MTHDEVRTLPRSAMAGVTWLAALVSLACDGRTMARHCRPRELSALSAALRDSTVLSATPWILR